MSDASVDYQSKQAVFFVVERFRRNRKHVHVGIPSSYRNTRESLRGLKMLWKHSYSNFSVLLVNFHSLLISDECATRVSHRAQKSRANNLIVLVRIYYSFKSLFKTSSRIFQKRQETAVILLTRVHYYSTHYLSQFTVHH